VGSERSSVGKEGKKVKERKGGEEKREGEGGGGGGGRYIQVLLWQF
jgi:hypothetical protein